VNGGARDKAGAEKSLLIAALGVVFGDIGTSPLYAMRECFRHASGMTVTPDNVLGVVSLVFWSLVMVVCLKYVLFVLRADNRGEGGILALMTLITKGKERSSKVYFALIVLGVLGAALLCGDSVITPAISVLSAVEGLNVATDSFQHYVVPLSLLVIMLLFFGQYRGTARIGNLFGPIMLLWFGVIGILGLRSVIMEPGILAALNPSYAFNFFARNGWTGFGVLGFVFLALTGVEVMYADMGHFGRKPITRAWLFIVFPALILNYFGQGAYLLKAPESVENLFYQLAPKWMLYPLVVLATVATIIASQAVISGAFSLARQTMQLGFWPRIQIIHTSLQRIGQVYVPVVNWALLIGTMVLVLVFRESGNLATAYGIAVSAQMLITTVLMVIVVRNVWGKRSPFIFLLPMAFISIDLAFFCSNAAKVFTGGWIVLVISGAIFVLMTIWQKGRRLLAEQVAAETLSLDAFIDDVDRHKPIRVPGIAVFLAGDPNGAPRSLLHNYKHNKVVHEKTVILSVRTHEIPFVNPADRLHLEKLGSGFYRAIIDYGFSETPDVPAALKLAPPDEIKFEPILTTYFLGRETLVLGARRTMWMWQKKIFWHMSHNALDATTFFRLPVNRVVELGLQVEL